jgi:ribonuclease BN (tRNA processing enzyme)
MKLTVVGCSGSLPGPDSPASCYLLEAPYRDGAFRLVLDLGSGAIGALQKYVDLRSVGAVAFSHLHADHCLDLCGFYVLRKHHPEGHWGRIPVYGPAGVARRMAAAYDMSPDPGMTHEFDFHEYDGRAVSVGPFRLETAEVDHPVDAYALRVSAGDSTLLYTGDTAPCAELDALAQGASLMLAEASFLDGEDNPDHLHLSGPEAAAVATRAGIGRLVLTHIPPWYRSEEILSEARATFAGELLVAVPGLTLTL